jgi:dihydrofolate reductase
MIAIFASAQNGAFGKGGGLPWPSIPEDFAHFKEKTMDSYVVMGRKTWETLPKLKGRTPVVISNISIPDTLSLPYDSHFPELLRTKPICLIGGLSLLTVQNLNKCHTIYHTEVKGEYEADVFLPQEVLDHLAERPYSVLLETDRCIIKEYR